MKGEVRRRLAGELRRAIEHRHREQFGRRDEAGEGGKPEIEPQRRKDDEDEIDQRHHEGQSLRRPHRPSSADRAQWWAGWFRSGRRDSGAHRARRGPAPAAAPISRSTDSSNTTNSRKTASSGRIGSWPCQIRSMTSRQDRIGARACPPAAPSRVTRIVLDPQQFGPQDFARQRALEISRHRRLLFAVIASPLQHRFSQSFRDGPKDQTRNLEIPRCAIAHLVVRRFASPRNDHICLNPACDGSASPRWSSPAASGPAARSHRIACSAGSRPSA